MTYGDIYLKAYPLKVFQIWELVNLLEEDWGFLGKTFIKERVKSWLNVQIRAGAIKQVNKDPAIFAFTEYADNWQSYINKKVCKICGKTFVPNQSKNEFCSETCKKQHYKQYHERRRTAQGMKTGSKRRWKKSEELLLLKLKNEGYTYEQISKHLGRSITSVVEKYKALTGVRKWDTKQF